MAEIADFFKVQYLWKIEEKEEAKEAAEAAVEKIADGRICRDGRDEARFPRGWWAGIRLVSVRDSLVSGGEGQGDVLRVLHLVAIERLQLFDLIRALIRRDG